MMANKKERGRKGGSDGLHGAASGRDRPVGNEIILIGRLMAYCGRNVRCAPLVDAYGCTYTIRRGVTKLDSTSFLTRLKLPPLFDAYEYK